METEMDNILPFFDILITRREATLPTTAYKKPTVTVRYLLFYYNRPLYVKQGTFHNLYSRALTIRQDQKELDKDKQKLDHDLWLNDVPKNLFIQQLDILEEMIDQTFKQ
jgi:hypothetical protein